MGWAELRPAAPAPALRDGVLAYRGYRLRYDGPRERLELPDGAVTLLFDLGSTGRLRIGSPTGAEVAVGGGEPAVLVGGLRTTACTGAHGGRLDGIEVLVAPWLAHTLLGGLPMDRVCDGGGRLETVLGGADGTLAPLAERLASAPSWDERFAMLDRVLVALRAAGPETSPQVRWAWRMVRRSGGRMPVAELARRVGWSERHLQTGFRREIGLPPKAVARVARLQRAARLLDAGVGPAVVADTCGYFDQPHLSREFRTMTGRTVTRFRTERAGTGAGADRLPGQVTTVVLR